MHPIKNSKLIKKSIHKFTIINNNNNIPKRAKKSSHNRNVEYNLIFGENSNSGIINNERFKLLFLWMRKFDKIYSRILRKKTNNKYNYIKYIGNFFSIIDT